MPSTAGSIVQMLVGLAIVLAALFGVLFLLRRLQVGKNNLVAGLRVIGATSVGPRERVVLLSVADKVLVLGVTSERINALHTLNREDLPTDAVATSTPAAGDFAARLRQFMEKSRAR